MYSEFSKKYLLSFCFIASSLLVLCLFQINELTIRYILAVSLVSFLFTLILRKSLKNCSSFVKISIVFSFFLSLTITALLLKSIKTLFPQPEALAFPLILSIPIAFFITLFLLIKEPVQKTAQHLFPWLDEEASHSENHRMIIPDLACLEDGRICDLVRTGLFDNQLILPHFLIEKVRKMMDEDDEFIKERAKTTFESIRRLEAFGIISKKNPEVKVLSDRSFQDKLLDYAKEHKAIIISNDSTLQSVIKPEHYDIPIIFLEAIASALKPTIPKGQQLSIKIQRPGKEPKQGIGYLDDRTMVVVNGGGDFIGQLVKIQILSQKFSASGKIIFCNLIETPNSEINRSYAPLTSNNDFQE